MTFSLLSTFSDHRDEKVYIKSLDRMDQEIGLSLCLCVVYP